RDWSSDVCSSDLRGREAIFASFFIIYFLTLKILLLNNFYFQSKKVWSLRVSTVLNRSFLSSLYHHLKSQHREISHLITGLIHSKLWCVCVYDCCIQIITSCK